MNLSFTIILLATCCSMNVFSMKRQNEGEGLPPAKITKSTGQSSSTKAEATPLTKQLMTAIRYNQIKTVKQILDAGVDVNALDTSGNVPLIEAIQRGFTPIIKLLVERGASVTKYNPQGHSALSLALDGQDPAPSYELTRRKYQGLLGILLEASPNKQVFMEVLFLLAIEKGNTVLVQKLLNEGIGTVNAWKEALKRALDAGQKRIVLILIEKGAPPYSDNDFKSLVAVAVAQRQNEAVFAVIKNSSNNPLVIRCALEFAIVTSNHELVRKLLNMIPSNDLNNPRTQSNPLLSDALKNNDIPMVKLLLKAGIPASDGHIEQAITKGDQKLTTMLIKSSANEHILDRALLKAAEQGNVALVKMLLLKGAKLSAKDEEQWTALHHAAFKCHKETIELFIKQGMSVNAQTDRGLTPLWLAVDSGSSNAPEIVELLCKAGANIHKKAPVEPLGGIPDSAMCEEEMVDALELAVNEGKFEIVHKLIILRTFSPQEVPALLERAYSKLGSCIMRGKQGNDTAHTYSIISRKDELFHNGITQKKYEETILLLTLYLGRIENDNDLSLYLEDRNSMCKETMQDWQKREDREACDFRSFGFHQTTLMLACIAGDSQNVQRLVKVGFPHWYINAQDVYGRTALIYAILYGHFDIARMLIPYCVKNPQCNHGADLKSSHTGLNLMDSDGNTALCYAVEKGDTKLVGELLINGANFISQQQIAKALKIATEKGYEKIMLMLIGRFTGNQKIFSMIASEGGNQGTL
jgi:uncharacterized protein